MRYLVDSDWIIDALNGQSRAVRVLDQLAGDGIGIAAFSYAEVYQGAYYGRDPADALQTLRAFMDGKDIVLPSLQAFERFAIVRGSLAADLRRQVGDLDLLIAAMALELSLILVTRNIRHFRHVPGLKLYEFEPLGNGT
jgi:predicted nucleic acid-binding protein